MVHMKILGNATLTPLNNLHNMQMKAAITDISFFDSKDIRTAKKKSLVVRQNKVHPKISTSPQDYKQNWQLHQLSYR